MNPPNESMLVPDEPPSPDDVVSDSAGPPPLTAQRIYPVEELTPPVLTAATPAAGELIVDYASPRPRVKLRLPANSTLVAVIDDAGALHITEALLGRESAVAGMIFGALMLVYYGGLAALYFRPRGQPSERIEAWSIAAITWLAYLALLLLVIHQTWRKTVLSLDKVWLRLRFSSLLHTRLLQWPAEELDQIRAHCTGTAQGTLLGELRLHLLSGTQAQLFTDHPLGEIDRLCNAIRQAHSGERPTLDNEATSFPNPQAIDTTQAQLHSRHLLDVQRRTRSRQW